MSTPKKKPSSTAPTTPLTDDAQTILATPAEPEKLRRLRRDEAIAVRAAVVDLDPEKISQTIASTQVATTRFLGEVNNALIAAQQELARLKAAAELEREDIRRIHAIDVLATDLDAQVAQYETKVADLEAQAELLQGEILQTKTDWETERTSFEKQRTQDRTREKESFDYARNKARQVEDDIRNLSLAADVRTRKLTMEDEDRARKQQGEALTARERMVAEAEKLHGTWDAAVASAAEAKFASAFGAAKRELEFKQQLALKDETSKTQLLQAQVAQLSDQVNKLQAQLDQSTTKLDQAQQRNAEIATKGLEAAGNLQALGAFQTAIGGGNNNTKGKPA